MLFGLKMSRFEIILLQLKTRYLTSVRIRGLPRWFLSPLIFFKCMTWVMPMVAVESIRCYWSSFPPCCPSPCFVADFDFDPASLTWKDSVRLPNLTHIRFDRRVMQTRFFSSSRVKKYTKNKMCDLETFMEKDINWQLARFHDVMVYPKYLVPRSVVML